MHLTSPASCPGSSHRLAQQLVESWIPPTSAGMTDALARTANLRSRRPCVAPQRLDPIAHRRVRREQAADALAYRVLDEERLHARGHVQRGVLLDLAQRADQRIGVLGQLRRARI